MTRQNGNGTRAGKPAAERGKRISRLGRTAGRQRVGHGDLLIIGGHEDKEGDKLILREVARRAGSGRLVVATVASEHPEEMFETYERVFRNLGVSHVYHFHIDGREEAMTEAALRVFEDATVVFFTGGDQLKIT